MNTHNVIQMHVKYNTVKFVSIVNGKTRTVFLKGYSSVNTLFRLLRKGGDLANGLADVMERAQNKRAKKYITSKSMVLDTFEWDALKSLLLQSLVVEETSPQYYNLVSA